MRDNRACYPAAVEFEECAPMNGQAVQEWLEGYRKAWVERDAEAAAKLYAPEQVGPPEGWSA
jgi:hypothetical protein